MLTLLRDKQAVNGGVVDDVTSVFDGASALPREQPTLQGSYYAYTRSSLQMPAAYELWAHASGDPFWKRAASAARAGLVVSADSKTGLWPVRNYFDGKLVGGSGIYRSAGYRTQFNFALDTAWGGGAPIKRRSPIACSVSSATSAWRATARRTRPTARCSTARASKA